MPVTSKGIVYPGPLTKAGNLNAIFATFAQSIDDAIPQNRVSTLDQLAALTAVPEGAMAVFTGYEKGLDKGAVFIRVNNQWLLHGNSRLYNQGAFIAAINSYPDIRTWAGGTFYAADTGNYAIWKNSVGGWWRLDVTPEAVGTGTVNGGVKKHKSKVINIKFRPNTFIVIPRVVVATTNSARITTGIASITLSGFKLILDNWSPANSQSDVTYRWTAQQ